MGGNAMAPFGARRFNKEEYRALSVEIFLKLNKVGKIYGWVEIPSFFSKDSFGDIDILCTNITKEVFDNVLTEFGNPPRYLNSGTLSLLYKELQVDLIATAPEDFNSSYAYFSYNDLGNLIGKLFHKFGLKYGHHGLSLPLRDGDNKFAEVLISKDQGKILDFLGLSYVEFLEGFDTLEDVFEYVIDSNYFDPQVFSFENMNAIARVRDKKRKTYNSFLHYIKDIEVKNPVQWKKNKEEYLSMIFNHFPEAWAEYRKQLLLYNEYLSRKRKFNGEKVLTWLITSFKKDTVVSGEAFGKFIKYLKAARGNDKFNDWVDTTSEKDIEEEVVYRYAYWYKAYKGDQTP